VRTIKAEPLAAEAFAPYGDLVGPPAAPGRDYFDKLLVNLRPVAGKPSLSFTRTVTVTARPVPLAKVERHQYSTQAFVPLAPDFSYLVGVMPMMPGGDAPDYGNLRVFVAGASQAINYKANVWHLPMQVIAGEGRFAVIMFNDGTATDTEFRDIPEAIGVVV
jgi:ureidoglycolate lyase